jgi:hypothetical protein
MSTFNICYWFTIIGSNNGKEALEERKGSINKKPHIHLHKNFKEDRGRKIIRGSYPFPLISKGEKYQRS